MESKGAQDNSTYALVRKLVQGMPGRLNRDAAKGLDATLQFDLMGEGGGNFAIIIQDQTCRLEEQVSPNPSAVMKMSTATYIDLAFGRITGAQAFFKRKLRFDGSLDLVMKLHTLFPPLSTKEQSLE